MSCTNHPVTRYHIPPEQRPELHHTKSLQPHTPMCALCGVHALDEEPVL